MNNTSNLKDKITNYAALLVAIIEGVSAYWSAHTGQAFDWKQLGFSIVVIIVAWYTGKAPNGTTKTTIQVKNQNIQSTGVQ
jgi:hypothetical protein